MRFLITGGAGFVGSHLADSLIWDGAEVVVIDDLSSGSRSNLAAATATGRLQLLEGSILEEDLLDAVMGSVDGCFHLAATVGVSRVVAHPLHVLTSDVATTELVLRTAVRHRTRALYTSSSEVYGKRTATGLDEQEELTIGAPSKSRWAYAISKQYGEALANALVVERDADIVVTRLFNAVGPRQTAAYGMVLPRFVRQALAGEPLTVYGDGTQSRCFTSVHDSVRALAALMTGARRPRGVYNVGSPVPVRVVDAARRVIERTGSTSEIDFIPYEAAHGEGFEELGTRTPDISALQRETDWAPAISLDQTIDEIIWHQYTQEQSPTEVPAAMEMAVA
jgi:UDP-glucose 4-epimerase